MCFSFLFIAGCREYAYFVDMYYSPAVDAQEEDFVGGRPGNFEPPENTLPYKGTRYTLTNSLQDYPKADFVLKSPFKNGKSTDVLLKGKDQYRIYCAPCHGMTGRGDGSIKKKWPSIRPLVEMEGVDVPPTKWGTGRIYHVIRVGIRSMQSYSSQITEENMWAISHYVKYLQKITASVNRNRKLAEESIENKILNEINQIK